MRAVPLHERIYASLREDIASERIGVGHRLPTENDLCERFSVSRITVRHALDRLQNDGLIVRAPRRGTMVRSKVVDRGAGWRVDTIHDIVRFGQHASLKVLSYEPVRFAPEDASILGVARGYTLEGLRCVRQRPIGFTLILLPEHVGNAFSRRDFRSSTVFTMIAERLGLQLSEVRERVGASSAGAVLAAHLKCPVGAPVLSVERVYFDRKRKPVELARSWYLAEAFTVEHKIGVLET
jgi:DNA-binding GntR family transcriptional regulator